MLVFLRPGAQAPTSQRRARARLAWTGTLQRIGLLTLACILSACGGGKGSDSTANIDQQNSNYMLQSAALKPTTNADAYRFLTQATFGPTPDEATRLKRIGYEQWIDEQFDMRLQSSHLDMVTSTAATLQLGRPSAGNVTFSWWTHAIKDPAQLRQRVAFALSEIFVVSTMTLENGRPVASYLDMLTDKADANFRDLLEAVAMHPAMGQYLSHLGNRKEDPSGRVPDENFAREIMQLFSIGLYELDDSGKPRLVNSLPVETYSANDISGLAKVFTGWSWNWPANKSGAQDWQCFWRTLACDDSSQDVMPMSAYAGFHSTSVKQFLGVTVAQQTTANPTASLKAALDRLADHPNTAPFISRQLIQRLVSSNPSDAYVADITRIFRSSGGNLRAVVKAILLHTEARQVSVDGISTYGKLREPVLRFSHLLRAIPHHSRRYDSEQANGRLPFYLAADSTDPGISLGQTPMRAPSVFNFFRPGYRPPQSRLPADMVAPEMQITSETSVLSYANFVSSVLQAGWGWWDTTSSAFDIQFDFSEWNSQATEPAALISAISTRLLGKSLPDDVQAEAVAAVTAMPASTTQQLRQRIQAAILLVAVSPSFIVQQ